MSWEATWQQAGRQPGSWEAQARSAAHHTHLHPRMKSAPAAGTCALLLRCTGGQRVRCCLPICTVRAGGGCVPHNAQFTPAERRELGVHSNNARTRRHNAGDHEMTDGTPAAASPPQTLAALACGARAAAAHASERCQPGRVALCCCALTPDPLVLRACQQCKGRATRQQGGKGARPRPKQGSATPSPVCKSRTRKARPCLAARP